jgi:hypothetical protein
VNEQAIFLASFPNTQSAITFHGAGGMRIQLDIPESEIGEAAQVLMWRERLLRVVIAPVEKDENSSIFSNMDIIE